MTQPTTTRDPAYRCIVCKTPGHSAPDGKWPEGWTRYYTGFKGTWYVMAFGGGSRVESYDTSVPFCPKCVHEAPKRFPVGWEATR